MDLRNRIVGYGVLDPADIITNPMNVRVHTAEQLEALGAALDTVGWVDTVTINRTTGLLLDGHARVGLALQRGEAELPVCYVELTPDEERLMLASYDRLGTLAAIDAGSLDELLREVSTDSPELASLLSEFAIEVGAVELDPPEQAEPSHEELLSGAGQEIADVAVKVGPVTFRIPRATYERWLERVRAEVGFTKENIVRAIAERMGFDASLVA